MPLRRARRTRPATGSAVGRRPAKPGTRARPSAVQKQRRITQGRRTRPATGSAVGARPAKLGTRARPSAVQKSRDISATKRRQRQAQQLKRMRAALNTRVKDRARRRGY